MICHVNIYMHHMLKIKSNIACFVQTIISKQTKSVIYQYEKRTAAKGHWFVPENYIYIYIYIYINAHPISHIQYGDKPIKDSPPTAPPRPTPCRGRRRRDRGWRMGSGIPCWYISMLDIRHWIYLHIFIHELLIVSPIAYSLFPVVYCLLATCAPTMKGSSCVKLSISAEKLQPNLLFSLAFSREANLIVNRRWAVSHTYIYIYT